MCAATSGVFTRDLASFTTSIPGRLASDRPRIEACLEGKKFNTDKACACFARLNIEAITELKQEYPPFTREKLPSQIEEPCLESAAHGDGIPLTFPKERKLLGWVTNYCALLDFLDTVKKVKEGGKPPSPIQKIHELRYLLETWIPGIDIAEGIACDQAQRCHHFALGPLTRKEEIQLLNLPAAIRVLQSKGYHKVERDQPCRLGDVVVYYRKENVEHYGKVSAVDAQRIKIRSKFGPTPYLYEHNEEAVPYGTHKLFFRNGSP